MITHCAQPAPAAYIPPVYMRHTQRTYLPGHCQLFILAACDPHLLLAKVRQLPFHMCSGLKMGKDTANPPFGVVGAP